MRYRRGDSKASSPAVEVLGDTWTRPPGDDRYDAGKVRFDASQVDRLLGWDDQMKSTVVRLERRTTIERPIADVFERLADIDGYSTWMSRKGLFGSCRSTTGDDETSYRDASRIGPWRGDVVASDRPTHLAFRQRLRWFGRHVMEARPTYSLTSDHGATSVVHTAEGELFGPLRVMKPMLKLMAERERRLTLEALKSSLESTGGPAATGSR